MLWRFRQFLKSLTYSIPSLKVMHKGLGLSFAEAAAQDRRKNSFGCILPISPGNSYSFKFFR